MLVPASRALRRLTLALFVLPLLAVPAAAEGVGGTERAARLKELQVRHMLRGAKRALARHASNMKAKAAKAAPAPGHGRKPAVPEPDPPGLAPLTTASGPVPPSVAAIANNYIVNNRAGDVGAGSGQCEVSIAAHGQNVVAAWNDGEGFVTGLSTQGFGYSTDGGVTWVDGGIPPTSGGIGLWTSDPVVTVNEKTGEFYFAALCEPTVSSNGIGVVRGTFVGGVLTWGTPELAISGSYSAVVFDKEWIAADSLTGNVYLVYSRFTVNGGQLTSNAINFQRKVGAAPFAAAIVLSSAGDAFRVQGSRVAVGPAGEVWATWNAIGKGIGGGELTDEDHMRVKRSTNAGFTFGTEITAANQYTNFGTGAPGFNRGTGFAFPGFAIDRSTGPNRGRAFLIWNESVNFYPDVIGNTGTTAEIEPNDVPVQGTTFTMGRHLTGTITTINDFDYFRFVGTAGQTVICETDAGPNPNPTLNASFRLFCSDGATRLAFSETGVGDFGLIVFTLPYDGTYTLRVASLSGTGAYTINTGLNGPVTERGRDHRDVFTSFSDNLSTWSVPARVNNDAALFDNWLPEIAVAADGKVFASWYDWRDGPGAICAGASTLYLARSTDGAASWPDGSPVSSVATTWTTISSNIAPNQGDYTGLYANQNAVYVCWSDGRNFDPDVFVAAPALTFTPVTVSVASTHVEPGLVRVIWYTADATAFTATAYRRSESGDWTSLGLLARDGTGNLVLEDRDVRPGARYHYRLGVREEAEEVFMGEVTVDVPAGPALAIEEIRPNPSDRELWVSFTLSGETPATLELIDVSGRRVSERSVSGAGRQTVDLAAGRRLPPGVYVIRLTQNGESVVKRASVVR